jgi:hypothetical protein
MTSRELERPRRRETSALLVRWWTLLVFLAMPVAPLRAQDAPGPSEHRVKAVFLVNFLKYVEWPAHDTNARLQIAHVGLDEFGDDLSSLVKSKTVDGRDVMLKHSDVKRDWRECHVLFISSSEKRRLPEILASVKGRPVLTVGESEDFLERGGMINFAVKGKNVRLEINLVAAEAAGLKISSRLLAIADVVKRK